MELENYPLGGKALSDKDLENSLFVKHKPSLKYAWDNGVAISRYLAELKEGRIIAKKCRKCGRTLVPPRMFCELCWVPTDEWVYVEDTGVVNTFSLCYINWDASLVPKGKDPHIPAVIELDGASKGMGIMHLLGEVELDKIKIGMKVKAVWKAEKEREGSITDILYWKPLE